MRISDWSSDVCFSDLFALFSEQRALLRGAENFVPCFLEQGAMLLRGVRPSPRTSGTLAPMAVDYDPPAGWLPNQTRHPGWRIETRSEEHTSELQSLMRISYAVYCLKKKTKQDRKST